MEWPAGTYLLDMNVGGAGYILSYSGHDNLNCKVSFSGNVFLPANLNLDLHDVHELKIACNRGSLPPIAGPLADVLGLQSLRHIRTFIFRGAGGNLDVVKQSRVQEFIDSRVESPQPVQFLKFEDCEEKTIKPSALSLVGHWQGVDIFWNGELL
jgi:hypothetical protein